MPRPINLPPSCELVYFISTPNPSFRCWPLLSSNLATPDASIDTEYFPSAVCVISPPSADGGGGGGGVEVELGLELGPAMEVCVCYISGTLLQSLHCFNGVDRTHPHLLLYLKHLLFQVTLITYQLVLSKRKKKRGAMETRARDWFVVLFTLRKGAVEGTEENRKHA